MTLLAILVYSADLQMPQYHIKKDLHVLFLLDV